MKGGGEVAVKVQRGGLKALFDQDLQVRGEQNTRQRESSDFGDNGY